MSLSHPFAVKVVLADDHDLVRLGIKGLLHRIEGVEVIAEARSGEELLAVLRSCRPDVVMTDLSMPGMDGIEAIAQIRAGWPDLPVLVLTMYNTPDMVKRAVASGASGYLMKNATVQEVEQALRNVRASGSYFGAEVTRLLMEKGEPAPADVLTGRQVEILTLLARGLSSKEIAYELGLSSKTIDVHRGHIMERLGIPDLAGLTKYAVRKGLVHLE
jgi:two-component system, NarL family, nitrate/nitrite response regulator NarL